MKTLGYYNGHIDEIENMYVPMDDRVSYFGDGIYDATNTRNHVPFLLEAHVDRFYRSAARVRMECEIKKPELMELLRDCARRVDSPSTQLYWQLTRGTAPRNHAFPEGVRPNLWITVREKQFADPNAPLRLITREDTRFLHCDIKTLNLLPAVMYSQAAREAGAGECVLHRGERVTECAHSNVHILKDGEFITAPADNLILGGITRMQLIKEAAKLGIPVRERPFTVSEMMSADEVIVSAASMLCSAAYEIDGAPVGGRDENTLLKLRAAMLKTLMLETEG